MKIDAKEKYLKLVNKKIAEVNQRLERLEFARNNSESAMTSQHDTQRETIGKDVDVQKIGIKNLETFKLFLQGAQEKSKIEEGALLSVEFENGEVMKDIIFAPLNVSLGEVEIVTAKSPLGAAILGKKVEDKISYQIGETKISGNIIKVE